MSDKYNYKKTAGALTMTETWEEIGTVTNDLPTKVDPTKRYLVTSSTELTDTLEGVVAVTKVTEYTPIDNNGEFPAPTGPPVASVAYNTTYNRSVEPLESFDPAHTFLTADDAAVTAFLSGQLVQQEGQWGYPQGVVGLLFTPVTLPEKLAKYKNHRDSGQQATCLLPSMSAEIKLVETYEGEIDGNNGVPESIKDIASDPDSYKPTVSTEAVVSFGGSKISGCTIDLNFAGYSISNTITNKKVLEGGTIKTKLEYTIIKNWQGTLNTGDYGKVELF